MARSRTKSKSQRRRDTLAIANRRLPPDVDINDDLRHYSPTVRFSPLTVSGRPSSVVLDNVPTSRRRVSSVRGYEGVSSVRRSSSRLKPFGKALQVLSASEPVALCVRRKRRQEVLFARKKAGRRGQRRPRWTNLSKLKCRR